MSATALAKAIRERKFTSEQVVRAFSSRARWCGEELGTNAEERFNAAIEDAKLADIAVSAAVKAGTTDKLGKLHGVPISIKDQIHMAGFDSTCGLAVRCYKPAAEDGILVRILRCEGAIPLVRTNVPQCLMLPESANAIWGIARNVFNRERTVGGSSGGEGGLVAAQGSPLGIGTDIGGSIRIPANFCGVFGFKPTPKRVSLQGIAVPRSSEYSGQIAIVPSAGPIARTVADLELVMKLWVSSAAMTESDVTIARTAWDDAAASGPRKLKIGYFVDDKYFAPHVACARAVTEAVDALRSRGHEVVPFEVDFFDHAVLYVKLIAAEGRMRGFIDGLEGEALDPMYAYLYRISTLPTAVRKVLDVAYSAGGRSKARIASLVRAGTEMSVDGYMKAIAQQRQLVDKLVAQWRSAGLDAVLCPGLGLPAFPHGLSDKLNQACSYTFVWNLLHFPAGSCPVSLVTEDEQWYSDARFNDDLSRAASVAAKGTKGLPVGVQLVALPNRDETCLYAMGELERALLAKGKLPIALPRQ